MKLQLSGHPIQIKFGNFNSSVEIHSEITLFHLIAVNSIAETTDVFVVPQINIFCRKIYWPLLKKNWSHLADVTLPPIDTSLVKILISIAQVYAHRFLEVRRPVEGKVGPIAINTPFGWAIAMAMVTHSSGCQTKQKEEHQHQINISQAFSLSILTDSPHGIIRHRPDSSVPNFLQKLTGAEGT